MIKKLLSIVGLCLIGMILTSCSKSKTPPPETTIKPCIIPSDLPNNAMGKLGIQTIQIGNTYRIIIPTDKVFEVRSAEIKESAYPGLDMLASYLNSFSHSCMKVTGYTDSLGSYPEDEELSEQQARSLVIYLWSKGIPHENFAPVGIGKDEAHTIASNRYVDGSVANRRIEITFKR